MSGRRGSSVVEALVAAALGGVALGALAASGALAVRALAAVRDTGTALVLASERLESLRAGRRIPGRDVVRAAAGTAFNRAWTVERGRGRPDRLAVDLRWPGGVMQLESEAFP